MWKIQSVKWKIFFCILLPWCCPFLSGCAHLCPTMGAIFTRCILHNSRERLSTLPVKRIPSALLLAVQPCCFVCSIVYPAEWYIAAALPVVRKWSHPSLQSRELRTLWTESKLRSYEEGDHLCRNSYFMFLHWEPSFLSCLEWKSKSHRTSFFFFSFFLFVFGFMLKEQNEINRKYT